MEQPSEIQISISRLKHNLEVFQNTYPTQSIAPVLKSNAYGHGILCVARILESESVSFFVLNSYSEAVQLRNAGIKKQILIIGSLLAEKIASGSLEDVSYTVTSLTQLQMLVFLLQKETKIHVKVDTGMGRQGILPNQIEETIKIISSSPFLILEGVCSHFADADNSDTTFTQKQIESWKRIQLLFSNVFKTIKYWHIGATAGAHLGTECGANMLRVGLGLYGINSSYTKSLDLKPVLELHSHINSIKFLPAGSKVGYGATYEMSKNTPIASVPLGYFEGVERELSNNGFFKVNGIFCPIIGRVSMNITTIDISTLPKACLGDRVIAISKESSEKNSIVAIAQKTKKIPWEIMAHLPEGIPRVLVE